MRVIALVGCGKAKRNAPSYAKDLYTGTLFRKARRYAERHSDAWFVLSAKYGLLEPNRIIAPYNETLNDIAPALRDAWAQRVMGQLSPELERGDYILCLAGRAYMEYLQPLLEERGASIKDPMRGLGIGKRIAFLGDNV